VTSRACVSNAPREGAKRMVAAAVGRALRSVDA
jgi:hypothetical protein